MGFGKWVRVTTAISKSRLTPTLTRPLTAAQVAPDPNPNPTPYRRRLRRRRPRELVCGGGCRLAAHACGAEARKQRCLEAREA